MALDGSFYDLFYLFIDIRVIRLRQAYLLMLFFRSE